MDEIDLLFRLARREIEDDDGETRMPSLVALHQRPTRDVFERAAALAAGTDATSRELGVRILREHRTFSAEAVSLLLDRLREETEPAILRWVVSALGYHGAVEALPQVVALADHPDHRVRFHVAAALPHLVDPGDVDPAAADALIRLCHDDDAETRYYAFYAATREIPGMDVETVTRTAGQLATDPDGQIRAMAVEYTGAVHELRELLGDAERRIGPADLLDEEIRRRLGTAALPELVEEFLSGWQHRA